MNVNAVVSDLLDEQAVLDAIVADLAPDQWDLATPSPGWTVSDQIAHLAFFDGTAAMAIDRPDEFRAHRDELVAAFSDAEAVDATTIAPFRAMSPAERLTAWRDRRGRLEAAATTLAAATRIEWYGPPMSATSFLTARLMEAWAHGQDVCDTVGATREPTDRLRHIAHLGVITRGWTYASRGLTMPTDEIAVSLTAPSGEVWTWGPPDAAASVSGTAEDFCLVVTQRRHRDDTALAIHGHAAFDWMSRAQAFAGAPTDGPAPTGAR